MKQPNSVVEKMWLNVYFLHSRHDQCAVRAVPQVPAWPERKGNLCAVSIVSHVLKESSVTKQVSVMVTITLVYRNLLPLDILVWRGQPRQNHAYFFISAAHWTWMSSQRETISLIVLKKCICMAGMAVWCKFSISPKQKNYPCNFSNYLRILVFN